ncbi:hypothetical protein ACW9ID_11635 [Pseudomonas gingeri]
MLSNRDHGQTMGNSFCVAAIATAIVNGPRERRVLIPNTSAAANPLKIHLPPVFSETDAKRLLMETEVVLGELLK